jgi:hypothetical protein
MLKDDTDFIFQHDLYLNHVPNLPLSAKVLNGVLAL